MTNEVLHVEDISKQIQKQTILETVSFSLQKGQVMALCGGNGAGKSTMLQMIVGITQPSSGHILVDGLERKKNRKLYANKIGYMPDDFQFGSALSAQETLMFYASLRGVSKDKVIQTLHDVGLYNVRNKNVSTFSKGMRQRLLFAQSNLSTPSLLVLDEPTNGLDPYWMDELAAQILQLKKAGQTIIFSTHHLQLAETVADHVIFLDRGKILDHNTLEYFMDKYASGGLNSAFTDLRKSKQNQ
ncbi:ABC transporter ATP-binding protein [Brevibacillus ginsengisoli]|uniref:ABC transporter ATP-binding protein n=1 Tax=Brevibacillus ginsengisoli TaxID=363854 RepID=UPI003CF2C791